MILTEKDFNTWSTQYTKGTNQKVSNGYKEATQEEESLILPETMFVKTKIEDAMAVKNPYLKRSVVGKKILDYGIISIDYIHQKIYFQPFDMVPIPEAEAKVTETKGEDGKLNPELIIGVPVGFVNVVQSKELIMQADVPYIVARGRKGGSNIAACICNALLYMIDNNRGY